MVVYLRYRGPVAAVTYMTRAPSVCIDQGTVGSKNK